MFWNYMMCFYYLGDILKQCDVFPSFWWSFEIMWSVSLPFDDSCFRIELVLFKNNHRQSDRNTSHCFKRSPKWWKHIALFQKIAKVIETCRVVSQYCQSNGNMSHCWNAEGKTGTFPLTCFLYKLVILTKQSCFTSRYCLLTEPGEGFWFRPGFPCFGPLYVYDRKLPVTVFELSTWDLVHITLVHLAKIEIFIFFNLKF